MKTYQISFGNSYPLYYTLKGKNDPKEHNKTFVTGVADITGSYLDTEPLSVGDTLVISMIPHVITDIVETRPAKGKHEKPATWYRVTTTYKKNAAN